MQYFKRSGNDGIRDHEKINLDSKIKMKENTIEGVIAEKGFYVATVSGDSMMPMLKDKVDLVKIVEAKGILKKYDVPLYKRPTGEYVLHRIVAVKKNHYIICGDNRFNKEKVPFDWVVGVLESFEKNGREIKVSDSEYLEYVKQMRTTFLQRRIKKKIRRMLK